MGGAVDPNRLVVVPVLPSNEPWLAEALWLLAPDRADVDPEDGPRSQLPLLAAAKRLGGAAACDLGSSAPRLGVLMGC